MKMSNGFFRTLEPQEEKEFRDYAFKNDPPDLERWGMYHPVCREIWIARGLGPVPAFGTS